MKSYIGYVIIWLHILELASMVFIKESSLDGSIWYEAAGQEELIDR